jgi:methyl-accepting chemotaxis protein
MLRNLKIGRRLAAVFAILALLAAIVGGFGVFSTHKMNKAFDAYVFHVVQSGQHAASIRAEMINLRRFEKDIVINVAEADKVAQYKQQWEATYEQIGEDFTELKAHIRDPEVAKRVEAAQEGLKSYHDSVAAAIGKLGGMDVAAANAALRAGRDGFVVAEKIFAETLTRVVKVTEAVKGEFDASARNALILISVLTVSSVALMIWMGFAVSASIVKPLHGAQGFAGAVRDGDLTGDIDAAGQDEAAELSRALLDMQTSLNRIVGEVRVAADSIQVASSEVASGNTDLSHRTEQTAASLQQAASAMNELTATVNQTADSAHTANQLASQASASAERGGAVVGEVVNTMERINQGSRRIADIIGTIDGIAFQTNILALNAAVEAARAGEAGRGFAVVAGEVRLLAGRSAEAAREIKSLITSSVESVEVGSRLVADAGASMQEIVSNVQRVSDIIGEISAAAGEQSSGIGSVNDQVVQLDQATQQNAALVEESAAAAQSLREQAQRLAEVVAAFKVKGMGGGMARSSSPAPAAKPKAAAPAPRAPAPAPAPKVAARPAASPAPSPSPTPVAGGDWESF